MSGADYVGKMTNCADTILGEVVYTIIFPPK